MLIEFVSEHAKNIYGEKLERATEGSAGFDLRIDSIDEDGLIGTGIKVAIPYGYVGLITPRSGLGFKYGVGLKNTVGVIDSDYRGEIKSKIITGDEFDVEICRDSRLPSIFLKSIFNEDSDFCICEGDRFCQMVVVPFFGESTVVDSLDETLRGDQGFGSTGND